MSYYSVDIEADGPIPGPYSMISIGAVLVKPGFKETFYREIKPISDIWVPGALAISGFSREDTLKFSEAIDVMTEMNDWIKSTSKGQARFVADNAGFDWMFTAWYFHNFINENPFGFSSTSLTSMWKGMQKDAFASFKFLRKTKHNHNALDDAKGNAEALIAFKEKYELKIKFE
jgi:DNA polymerase III epsilon subunit-like protein